MRRIRSWLVRGLRLEGLFIAVYVLLGFRVGAIPITDNSMLTHLRTGIDMVTGGGIPRVDPYSFTAGGTDWVVQSWLASLVYGGLAQLGGFRAVVALQAVLLATLAWLMARLARAGSPLRTALGAGLVIGLALPWWAPRPLLVGLVCMAAAVTVVDRRRSPWLLVPVVWVWVNSHGSFPLGAVWLGARAVGEWRDWRARPSEALRYLWAFLGAGVVAVLNPLGLRLLLFPLTALSRREVFAGIREWQSPDFVSLEARIALLFLAGIVLVLVRFRLSWRDGVPVAAFLALGLLSARNLPVAAIVFAPVVGRALRAPESARIAPDPTPGVRRAHRAATATLLAAFVVFAAGIATADGLALGPYPRAAVDHLERSGLLGPGHRLAHQDAVGNYLELRYGTDVKVFIDDRYDMYPVSVTEDYRRLLAGNPQATAVLDHYGIDVVLWERRLPLASILAEAEGWQPSFTDDEWVVYERQP